MDWASANKPDASMFPLIPLPIKEATGFTFINLTSCMKNSFH